MLQHETYAIFIYFPQIFRIIYELLSILAGNGEKKLSWEHATEYALLF